MKPTDKPTMNTWPSAAPVSCCKDETTERMCLENVNNGKPCVWLAPDAPLAIKFNTQCLGESIVNGRGGKGNGEANGNSDVCHPIAYDYSANANSNIRRRYSVQNGSMATTTASGYDASLQIGALLSVATVLAICGYSMCKQRQEEKYLEI